MGALILNAVLAIGAVVFLGVSHAPEAQAQRGGAAGATRVISSGASLTVLSTLVSRGNQLVVLVLWRGAPGWLARAGRASTQGGGTEQATWVQLTRGDVTVDLDINHATGVARLLGRQLRLGDHNVVLVDRADTTATIVKTLRVDPNVPDTLDAPIIVLQRDPALREFLQCELMQADPIFGRMVVATHPCGRP